MNRPQIIAISAITAIFSSLSVIVIFRLCFPDEDAKRTDVLKALDVRSWDIDSIDGSQLGVRLVGPDGVIDSSGTVVFAPGESKRLVMLNETGGLKRFCIYSKNSSGTFTLSIPAKYAVSAPNTMQSIKPGMHLVKYGIHSASTFDQIAVGEAALVLHSE